MNSYQSILDTEKTLWDLIYNRWLSIELFSSNWFIMLLIMIVAYILLVKYIDRSRLVEILLYGSLLAVSYGFIDVTATTVGWWAYETRFVPLIPSLFPITYTLHPILNMAVYQLTFSWRSFLIWNTIVTALFAYVGLPLFVWLHILHLGNWSYTKSFVVALGISTLAKAVIVWLIGLQEKGKQENQAESYPLASLFQPATKTDGEGSREPKKIRQLLYLLTVRRYATKAAS